LGGSETSAMVSPVIANILSSCKLVRTSQEIFVPNGGIVNV